ncbi:MAG: ABC transporter permease [Trueperaceae bacterium]
MDNTLTTPLEQPRTSDFEHAQRSGSLNFAEILRMAWRSIRGNMTRSLLTALGVIIGVAAVIALTGIGAAVSASVNSQFSELGTNRLTISSGEPMDGPPGASLVLAGSQQTISSEDAEAIRDLRDPRIAGIAPSVQKQLQVKSGEKNENYTIIGTWADYAAVQNSPAAFGTFFTAEDESSRQRVAVVGADVAEEFFSNSENSIGQRILIDGNSFTIVGVLEDKSGGFGNPNENIIIPLSTYLQRLEKTTTSDGKTAVSSIAIQGSETDILTELQVDLEALMASRRDTPNPEDYDFNIQNQVDQLDTLNSVLTTLQIFLGLVAGISLLVGGIGIMNIMLVSVTERTREIGIRKALGAKPRDILAQFLLESIVLSGTGGLVGVILGLFIAIVASSAFGALTVPITGTLMAFTFAVAVGVFFGWYPARRAAALDPVESLRYE